MQEGGRAEVAEAKRSRVLLAGAAAAVIAVDQASKAWAVANLGGGRRIAIPGSLFNLSLVHNPGSAFGLFGASTRLVFAASLAILAAVTIWAVRNPEAPVRLGMVIGGGAGNLVDRIFRPPGLGAGHVVDFINFSFWPAFPTFNLADSAIVVAVTLLLAEAIKPGA
ncbi:MAG: signal peptidase II [Actinomycetota bacterium]|nr:signal peptidase II [Actinomycetota bacterium]